MILAALGALVAAAAGAAAILLAPGRLRSASMLAGLLLFPVLILGDQWSSPQISDLRDDPSRLLGFGVLALAAALTLAAVFRRWPRLLPLAIVAALPLRVPLEAGGDTANLLVPLYLVIAGGVLATAARNLGSGWVASLAGGAGGGVVPPPEGCGGGGPNPASAASLHPEQREGQGRRPTAVTGPAREATTWLARILAAVVALYALQTLYSPDFSKSLQNVCFFYVPFSLAFGLMRDVEWDRRLLALVLWVVALEGVAFVLVGSIEYATRSLFWNDQVIRSNDFHTYFRVNSVFWDPNIYGRYLALAIAVALAALLWARERRAQALLAATIAILWVGLAPTFSQSSFAALLGGLAVIGAVRWSLRWALAAVGAIAVLAVLVVIFAGGISKLSPDRINVDTGGRANLVSGGADLFAQRPLWGYGAGSFPRAYREHVATREAPVSVSHTQLVTVAAEQGAIGLLAYGALLAVALWTMAAGISAAPGPARLAVLAAFVALLVHSMAYAGFFEDPIAWVLLAAGASLAAGRIREGT